MRLLFHVIHKLNIPERTVCLYIYRSSDISASQPDAKTDLPVRLRVARTHQTEKRCKEHSMLQDSEGLQQFNVSAKHNTVRLHIHHAVHENTIAFVKRTNLSCPYRNSMMMAVVGCWLVWTGMVPELLSPIVSEIEYLFSIVVDTASPTSSTDVQLDSYCSFAPKFCINLVWVRCSGY